MVSGQFTSRRRKRSNQVASLLRDADLSGHVETSARSDGSSTIVRKLAPDEAAELVEAVRLGLQGHARVELVLAITWNQ